MEGVVGVRGSRYRTIALTTWPTVRPPVDPSAVMANLTAPTPRRRSTAGAPEGHLQGCARSEEHTSELQSLMRISYGVFCLQTERRESHTRHTRNSRRLHKH